MLGPPDTVVDLGETEVSEEIFMEYLSSLGESAYRFSNFFFRPNNTNKTYLLLIILAHVIVMNRKHYFMTSLYSLYNQFHIG